MATIGGSSSSSLPPSPAPPNSSAAAAAEKPVIVRVKRKSTQSRLDAFWLEINERPFKRPLLDFQKLSISGSSDSQVEEVKSKKVFVQHVETVTSFEATADVVQLFLPSSGNAVEGKAKGEQQRKLAFKKDNIQEQVLSKSRESQQILAKNARFQQIWRSRRVSNEALEDEELRNMCQFYDVVRVDVDEKSKEMQEHGTMSLEDQRLLHSYLPLLREFIPSAADDIESDIYGSMSRQESKDDYVYDYYAMREDIRMEDANSSPPFPLVQVEDEEFYDGPDDDSGYDTEDSNAEAHPFNEYPDEISEEAVEEHSEESTHESEEQESDGTNNGSDVRDDVSEGIDPEYYEEIDDDSFDDNAGDNSDDFDDDDEHYYR